MASLSDRVARKRQGRKTTVRIQIHQRLQVPAGYTLSNRLVAELMESWVNGDDLPGDSVTTAIDWQVGESGHTREKGVEDAKGVDETGDIRTGFIQRFLPLSKVTTALQNVGEGENTYGEYAKRFTDRR